MFASAVKKFVSVPIDKKFFNCVEVEAETDCFKLFIVVSSMFGFN